MINVKVFGTRAEKISASIGLFAIFQMLDF